MRLIINADDFGLTKSITDGILDGLKEGVLTSTSIMANMLWTKYAVEKAVENGLTCVGLHTNLTVGKPILQNSHLTETGGDFVITENKLMTTKS